jgi:hypothetical protein
MIFVPRAPQSLLNFYLNPAAFLLFSGNVNSSFDRIMKPAMIFSRRALVLGGLVFLPCLSSAKAQATEPSQPETTNTFPTVPEVLGGRTFENRTEQDIFFLQAIHDRYASHWTDLLTANITLNDFVLSPDKLLRFVNELAEAMRGRNDPAACTNLAQVVCDPAFYANTNVNRPELLQAAARALIKIGPDGRKALASAFTESHYRSDPASLEVLADAIGGERQGDPEFVAVLTATVFSFRTTNDAFYPRCATAAVQSLLCLDGGLSAVRAHLKIEDVLDNPGLFQSVMDGIAGAQASDLSTNLADLRATVQIKLAALAGSPGGYRDDLQELEVRIGRTLASFDKKKANPTQN